MITVAYFIVLIKKIELKLLNINRIEGKPINASNISSI